MTNKRWAMAAAMFLGLAMVAGSAWAQGPRRGPGPQRGPGPDDYRPPVGPPPTQGPVSLSGGYEEIVREANMTPMQQKNVGLIATEEQKALAKFDQQHAKQLDDINKKLNDAQRKMDDLSKLPIDANTARQGYLKQIEALRKQSGLIAAARERLSRIFKVRAMGLLTPPQKVLWVSYMLNRMMTDEFMPVGLTQEQQAAVKALCDRDALTATKPDVASDQALVDMAKQQVVTTVLNDEQRQKYGQMLQERQNRAAGILPAPA